MKITSIVLGIIVLLLAGISYYFYDANLKEKKELEDLYDANLKTKKELE